MRIRYGARICPRMNLDCVESAPGVRICPGKVGELRLLSCANRFFAGCSGGSEWSTLSELGPRPSKFIEICDLTLTKMTQATQPPAPSGSSEPQPTPAVGTPLEPAVNTIPAAVYPKILLLGDSLTQQGSDKGGGWANILQRTFLRRADVCNRGLSGWTSRWGMQYCDAIVRGLLQDHGREKFLFATAWFGANDACLPSCEGKRRYVVELEEYKENMKTIGRKLLAHTDVLLLLSAPCVHEGNRRRYALELCGGDESKVFLDRTNEHVFPYVEALREVRDTLANEVQADAARKAQKKVIFVDAYDMFFPDRGDLLPDGLHFSEVGDARVAEVLLGKLREIGIHCEPDALRAHYGCSGAKSSLGSVLPWHDDAKTLR